MKLLMITRKVDPQDALAGFAYVWVKRLGERLEKLYVISWQDGSRGDLPDNIEVFFLGSIPVWQKILRIQKILIKLRSEFDGVFCHMNPEYTLVSAPIAKLMGRQVVSWYTHKAVTWRRRLMEVLASRIITASVLSFRRPWFKGKVKVIGHGIDTNVFKPKADSKNSDKFTIITVGRISPTKDYESIIKALDILNNKNVHPVKSGGAGPAGRVFNGVKLKIVGDVILSAQKSYLESLQTMVKKMRLDDQVEFVGWVANRDMPTYYQQADLFISMSGTGSVDKVVLEAMSCGLLVLTSNEAFVETLPPDFIVEKNNPAGLADKINKLRLLPESEKSKLTESLRADVVTSYDLSHLVEKIIQQFK